MNFVLHQFKTDCRHFRWWLLAAWLSFVTQLVITRVDPPAVEFNFILEMMLLLLQGLLSLVLVVRVVQADPLVGSSAGWMTRPLRRAHLFAAKTAFLLLGLLIPRLLFQSADWLARGYSFELWLAAAAESLFWSGTLVFGIAALASVTRTLPQFFLAAGLTVAALFVWAGTVELMERVGLLDQTYSNRFPESLDVSRTLAGFSVLLAGGLIAWIVQGRFGRTRCALVILSISILAVHPLLIVWSIDFIRPEPRAVSDVQLSLMPDPAMPAVRPGTQVLWSHFVVSNLPPKHFVVAQDWYATFYPLQGGKSLSLNRYGSDIYSGQSTIAAATSDQASDYYGLIQTFFPPDTLWFGRLHTGRRTHLSGTEEYLAANRNTVGRFVGTIETDLREVERRAELPLEPGIATVEPGLRVQVEGVRLKPYGFEIQVQERTADVRFRPSRDAVPPGWRQARCVYVLYHARSREAFVFDLSGEAARGGLPSALSSESRLHLRLAFPYPALRERLGGVSAREWLAGARLCVFLPTYRGTLRQDFREESYTLSRNAGFATRTDSAPDPNAARNATLPTNPTEVDIAQYLDVVLANANDAGLIQSKVRAIGSNGVPVLLRRLPIPSFYGNGVRNALRPLLTREHLPELREALKRDPSLAGLFIDHQWEAEARDILMAKLPEHVPLNAEALRIVAGGCDPNTYSDLKRHFLMLNGGHDRVITALEKCPGFDVDGMVVEVWKRARMAMIDTRGVAIAAAARGLPEAFNVAVVNLERTNDQGRRQRESVQLAALAGYTGPAEESMTWLSENLGRIRYDVAGKRYVRE